MNTFVRQCKYTAVIFKQRHYDLINLLYCFTEYRGNHSYAFVWFMCRLSSVSYLQICAGVT